jgi:predicted transposase/invertase (TIGR01784 family)
VESRKPAKLLKHLREVRGYTAEKQSPGIYRITGDIIPIQIIDNRELSAEENLWLKGLSKDLEIGSAMAILKAGSEKVKEMPLAAYMQVVLNANAGVFLEVGRMGNGSLTFDDVLVELGLTARWKEEGREEGREKGREEIARNALAKGLPLDTIGEITGLDIETIKKFTGK